MKAADRESRLAKLLADALHLVPSTSQAETWRANARAALLEPHSGDRREPPALIERMRADLSREVEAFAEHNERTFANGLLGLMPDGSQPDQVRLSDADLCKLEPGMVVRSIDRRTGLVTFDLPEAKP